MDPSALDPAARADARGAMRVLVADDDPAMRRLLSEVLRDDGFEVSEARNGSEVVEIVEAALAEDGVAPDVIVSDVRMPGRTGLDALAALGSTLSHTAVVVITAFGDEATHAMALRLGAVRVLDKPFDLEDLRVLARELAHAR